MKHTLFGLALLALASAAAADTLPNARYAEMMKMPLLDTNGDGMVSREEFIAAAGKMFDMAAEHMKAKDGRMTANQLAEFRRALATPR